MKRKIFSVIISIAILLVSFNISSCGSGYKIQYNTDGNGTIQGESVQKLKPGEQTSTVSAVPNEGYQFVKWSDDYTESTRKDVVQKSSLTLTAIFEKCKYAVSYSATDGGIIIGSMNQTVEYGESTIEVKAQEILGYRFIKWSDNDSTNIWRKDTNVNSNINATAIFEAIRYDVQFVNYQTDGNGVINGQTYQQVVYNESAAAVTAIPNEGYEFLQWSDGVKTAERQDLNVTENINVTAQFRRIFAKYKLNYNLGESDTDITELKFYDADFKVIDFPVPTRELFTFGGWYIGDKQVTDINGKMTIGEELLKSPENEIYAKWQANENHTYKILMVYVTELDAVIHSLRGNGDFNIYYKMSDFDIQICKVITKQVSKYLNELLDGLVTFEVDEYFTTIPVGSESIKYDEMVNYIFAYDIPEIIDAGLSEEYQSILTVFCMDDYSQEFHKAAGVATKKYGTIYLESVYGATKINNEPLENILDINFWRWDLIVDTFIHELAHTIEHRIHTYNYHYVVVSHYHVKLGVDILYAEKLYFNNQALIDGYKVGIPIEFWRGEIATVTYLFTEGGYVPFREQEVIYGSNAESVTAIPFPGYEFVGWSDGILTATRTDLNIYSDFTVTAIFREIE